MAHSLVVGGTRGAGKALVRQMAERGDTVSVIGRSGSPEPGQTPKNARFWAVDLLDLDALKRALGEIVAVNGKLNYVVFCQRYRGKEDDWAGEFAVTLTATKTAVETLKDQFSETGDKAIVMISSVFGDFIGAGQPAGYHIGKAGLNQLMRFYAVNLGGKGIRANAASAFTFLKEESRDFYLSNEPLHRLYQEMIPLGRMGRSEDLADLALFLCSQKASFINGQNIYVDGGLSVVWPETLGRRLRGI